jgi:glycosyltransferase involved in cell wall biosynthesis
VEKGTVKKVLVIVPCYNEAENVGRLYAELAVIAIPGCSLTPLFINDASTDSTLRALKDLGTSFLDNPVNLGIGGTVQLGFMYALQNDFDIAVQVDGDGQHPPSELHKLLKPLLEDTADVVIGSRFIDNAGFRSTGLRRAGIRMFVWLNRMLAGIVINDSTSGFRSYNRKAFRELVHYYPDEYPEPEALVYLANKKLRLLEVPVLMTERRAGSSSIRSIWSVYYMAKVTLNILFLHARRQ